MHAVIVKCEGAGSSVKPDKISEHPSGVKVVTHHCPECLREMSKVLDVKAKASRVIVKLHARKEMRG